MNGQCMHRHPCVKSNYIIYHTGWLVRHRYKEHRCALLSENPALLIGVDQCHCTH